MKIAAKFLTGAALVAVILTLGGCVSMMNAYKVNQSYKQKTSGVEFLVGYFTPQDKVLESSEGDNRLVNEHYLEAAKGSIYEVFSIQATNPEAEEKHLPMDAVSVTMDDGSTYGPATGLVGIMENRVESTNPYEWKKTRVFLHGEVIPLQAGKKSIIQMSFLVPTNKKMKSINLFGEALPISGEKIE